MSQREEGREEGRGEGRGEGKEEGKYLALSTRHIYFYGYRPASQGLPTFLFLHDFPCTSTIWNKVVEHLLGFGFGVLRPDLLGFGKTSKPTDLHDYSLRKMSSEMVEILAHHQLKSVIGVGHGMGTHLLARMWWYYPQYLSGLAFMGAGYILPIRLHMELMSKKVSQLQLHPSHYGGYWSFIASEEAAQLLNSNIPSFLSIIYAKDQDLCNANLLPRGGLQQWIADGRYSPSKIFESESDADMEISHSLFIAFMQHRFDAPLNWFKSINRRIDDDHEEALPKDRCIISRPVDFLAGRYDALGRPDFIQVFVEEGRQSGYLPLAAAYLLQKSSHWMMIEESREVTIALGNLASRVMKDEAVFQPKQP
ncbi:hypothetical protein PMIN04_002232 [Paraphaeosphaeria minitans]